MKEIYIALASIPEAEPTPEVIHPVVEPINKDLEDLYLKVKEDYLELVISPTNLEEFSKSLNALVGILNLPINTITNLAIVSNKIREESNLPPL